MKRLTINLNNTAAWFEDEDNKTVTVLTNNRAEVFEQPDELRFCLNEDGETLIKDERGM